MGGREPLDLQIAGSLGCSQLLQLSKLLKVPSMSESFSYSHVTT